MSRRYYRRRSKDDPLAGLGFVLVLLIIATYYKLTTTEKELAIVGLVILVAVVVVWFLNRQAYERRKLRALEMIDLDHMDPLKFEKYVAEILKDQGYTNVSLTEYYDLGIDIVANKGGIKWGIQVKRYTGVVKAEAVRQVVTALNKYGCSRSMVVTNSTFSRPARVLAGSNNCVLIDRDTLAEWILVFQGKYAHEESKG